ncbi:uncharacterized protein [Tenebrio molitor]|uniref:uncharacterized protein isoform X2 n=1 Tax=Tenebrio molitor TaxID=7067 RepID=UPI00362490AC
MSIHKSCRKMCPDFIVNDFVTGIIKTIPVRTGYRTIRVTLKNDKLTDKSLTFSDLTPLSVVCRKGCLVDIVDITVKSAPRNIKLRQFIPINALFSREVFFYNTVVTDLQEFQDEIHLKLEDRFQGVPTLIAATLNEENEAIILQNAGTFENKQTIKIIQSNVDQGLKFFSDGNVTKRLKKFGEEVEFILENSLNESSETDVLVHGDPSDNFLFSYEKADEHSTVSRAKLINWQLVRFGSPILDLSVFFFTNCSFDDLQNLPLFLKRYYQDLELYLQKYQCDINDFFPFERLEDHWKKYAKVGLALTFITLKILTATSNRKPNANNEHLTTEEFIESFVQPPNEEFIRRIKDVVKYCVDNELI